LNIKILSNNCQLGRDREMVDGKAALRSLLRISEEGNRGCFAGFVLELDEELKVREKGTLPCLDGADLGKKV
jgi:hypothetical protein